MNVTDEIIAMLGQLTPERLTQLRDFAAFLAQHDEEEGWRQLGLHGLAAAYGDDEPEYSLDDIKKLR